MFFRFAFHKYKGELEFPYIRAFQMERSCSVSIVRIYENTWPKNNEKTGSFRRVEKALQIPPIVKV